jgi:hypothetical protein
MVDGGGSSSLEAGPAATIVVAAGALARAVGAQSTRTGVLPSCDECEPPLSEHLRPRGRRIVR